MTQHKYTVREMDALYEVWKEDMQELEIDLDELRSDTLEILEEKKFLISTEQLINNIDYIALMHRSNNRELYNMDRELETKLKHHLTVNALDYIRINMLESI